MAVFPLMNISGLILDICEYCQGSSMYEHYTDLCRRTSHVHSYLGPDVEKFLRGQSGK
jgi:hypothetical protein